VVEQRLDVEALGGKPGVCREGAAEVAHPHDGDRPGAVEAKGIGQLSREPSDVVANPPDTV